MKAIVFILFALSFAIAHPVDEEKPKVEVIKQEIVHRPDKGYSFE